MKAIIEMTAGTLDKCEVDKTTGQLVVDRKLSVACPRNYGFLDNTLASDGDPLDVFVLCEPLPGLSQLEVVPIGVFICKDQGVWDHKIVGVPFDGTTTSEDRASAVQAIGSYLMTYKAGFEVLSYTEDILVVMRVLRNARLHRNRPVFEHESLGWLRFASLLILAGLLALVGIFTGKHK